MKTIRLFLALLAAQLFAAEPVIHKISVWLVLAEQGDPVAERTMISAYNQDLIPDESYPGALKLFLKFAEKGDLEVQKIVAMMYAQGQGTPRNETESVKWLDRKSVV